MYGGRAIDNFDRRILNTYMDEYMGDFIFDTFQPFHFYCNDDVDYRIPDPGMKDKYTGRFLYTSDQLYFHKSTPEFCALMLNGSWL